MYRDGVVEADSPNWLHAVDPSTHPKHETIPIAKLFPTSSRQFSTDKEQNAPHYEIDPQTTPFCFSSSAKAMDFRAHNLFTSRYNTSCNMHIALPSKIKPLTVIHIIREFNFRRLSCTCSHPLRYANTLYLGSQLQKSTAYTADIPTSSLLEAACY